MTAIIAVTIAPEAMNTASDCQKVKLTPKAKNRTMNASHAKNATIVPATLAAK
jgi:hypothetical protein